MEEPKIPGGYILLSRKIIESSIWDKPPLYLKVWIYLLGKSQHKPYKNLEKGQLITSIPEIIKACSWLVGYRREYPTKDQIYQIIDWLRNPDEDHYEADTKATMIATTKATQSMLVTICNYSFYQDSKNYESNSEGNNEPSTKATRKQRQPNNINKNDKNVKNEKKDIYSAYTANPKLLQTLIDFENMRSSLKNGAMTDKARTMLLNNLSKLADTDDKKIAILEQSIFNNWKGIFPIKQLAQQQQKKSSFSNFENRKYDGNALEEQLLQKSRGELA